MKKSNKYMWIPWLMGFSQLLLTGFVVYWLFGQFKAEREGLHKVMHYEFIQAQDQAMDSSLQLILQPLLNDSLGEKDSSYHAKWIKADTVFNNIKIGSTLSPDGHVGDHIIQFDIKGEKSATVSNSSTYEITSIPNQDAVLRGVKMIIQMSEDSADQKGINSLSTLPEIDSAVLLKLADDRLKNLGHPDFDILWYKDSTDSNHSESDKRLRYYSGMSHPQMIFEITNYESFLIKEIIPQVLFGLLLLFLTGSAFIFTYRSLRKQLLLNTLRNEFISNVSHELKTPVSTVKVALESLQNYDQKKDVRVTEEYLKMASMEMDRLDMLIQKILNQSLLENNKVIIQKKENDLVQLSRRVLQTQKPRLDELKGVVNFYPDSKEAILQFDELYIQGVLTNLIDNAIKYGGSPPEIDIHISTNVTGEYQLSVSDNGEGIPKEFRQKVFERFFRIPSGDRHNVKGYGLGLSFAFEVMKQHGGEIQLKNNPSGGSIFTLYFKHQDEA